MEIYTVQRNLPVKYVIIAILIVLFLLIIPTKEKTISFNETYTIIEERNEIIPIEIINEELVEVITKDSFVEFPYELSLNGEMYRTSKNGKDYANQDYVFEIDKDIEYCIDFFYEFFDDDVKVNNEKVEHCLNDTGKVSFTLTELYTGDINDHYFKLTILNPPGEVKESATAIRENVTVTSYENVTQYVNVTRKRTINETVRVNWLIGIKIF